MVLSNLAKVDLTTHTELTLVTRPVQEISKSDNLDMRTTETFTKWSGLVLKYMCLPVRVDTHPVPHLEPLLCLTSYSS